MFLIYQVDVSEHAIYDKRDGKLQVGCIESCHCFLRHYIEAVGYDSTGTNHRNHYIQEMR